MLAKYGRNETRIKAISPELIQHDARPPREETIQHGIYRVDPIHVPREGRFAFRITPTRRFTHDRAVDFVFSDQKTRAIGLRSEEAVIKKISVNAVRYPHSELGVLLEPEPNVLRIALGQRHTGTSALRERVAGRPVRVNLANLPVDDAGAIRIRVQQRVFGVVDEESEAAMLARAVPQPVPVVGRIVAEEIRDRRVEIAAIKNDQHVVDEIIDFEQVFVSRVGRAIDVQALHLEVSRVGGQAVRRRPPQARPGRHVAVGRKDIVTVRDLDRVVIVFVTTVVRCAVRRFRPFAGVVQTPILAIDVKMIKVAALALLAHCQLRVAGKLVAEKNPSRVALETPGIVLECAQIDLVKGVGAVVTEERILQF